MINETENEAVISAIFSCLPLEGIEEEHEFSSGFAGQVFHQAEYVPIAGVPFPPRKENCFARCFRRVCSAKATHLAIGSMLSLAGIAMITVADTTDFGATGETGKVMTTAGVVSFISGLIWATVGIVTIEHSEHSGVTEGLPLLPNSGNSGRTLTKYV